MKPNRLVIYPGFMSSSDAHAFKKEMDALLVYREGKYRPTAGDFIIGWGNGRKPIWADTAERLKLPIVNHWDGIKNAVDKHTAMFRLDEYGVRTVPFTDSRHAAYQWLKSGLTVIARTNLRGMKGAGIVVVKPGDIFVDAPLYTKFQPDCEEYRVHVAFGKVINYQQKKRKNGVKHDPYVRSEENGYVFCRKGVNLPHAVGHEAIKGIKALGLDFGGVDILWNPYTGSPMILEVNTAPGLDYEYGIEAYVNAFNERIAQE